MSNSEIYSNEELREVQLCELDILKKYVEICEKYKLVYFLDSGTALGAARHQGFIPWDDDIDVGMPRKDYEKFLEIAQFELGEDYFLQNVHTDPGCPFVFSKIRKNKTAFVEWNKSNLNMNHGIFIDIFPYDVLPRRNSHEFMLDCNKIVSRFYLLYITKRARPDKMSFKWAVGDVAKRLISKFGKLKNKKKLVQEMEIFFTQYNDQLEEDCSLYCPFFFGNYEFNYDMLFPTSKLMFEGLEVCVPNKWDEYLTMIYGDYMQLPPPEKRRGHRPLIIDTKESFKPKK